MLWTSLTLLLLIKSVFDIIFNLNIYYSHGKDVTVTLKCLKNAENSMFSALRSCTWSTIISLWCNRFE